MAEYIEREAIFKAYEEEQRRPGPWRFETLINSIPSADVAPVVHAYWVNIVCDGYCREHSGECSHCGERSTFRFPEIAHFCSNCGAKMDLKNEGEEEK